MADTNPTGNSPIKAVRLEKAMEQVASLVKTLPKSIGMLHVFAVPPRSGQTYGSAWILANYLNENRGATVLLVHMTERTLSVQVECIARHLNANVGMEAEIPTVNDDGNYEVCLTLDAAAVNNIPRQVLPIPNRVDVVFISGMFTCDASTLRRTTDRAIQYTWTYTSYPLEYIDTGFDGIFVHDCLTEHKRKIDSSLSKSPPGA
jgi:hypothetical protein